MKEKDQKQPLDRSGRTPKGSFSVKPTFSTQPTRLAIAIINGMPSDSFAPRRWESQAKTQL